MDNYEQANLKRYITDFNIPEAKTNFKFIYTHNEEYNSKVLFPSEDLHYIEVTNEVAYIHLRFPIAVAGVGKPVDVLEIDLTNPNDTLIGYKDYCLARHEHYEDNECNNVAVKPDTKLIFSPQLANYLLDHGYQIIHIKPHNNVTNAVVFVFYVSKGFYETIAEWKKLEGEQHDN